MKPDLHQHINFARYLEILFELPEVWKSVSLEPKWLSLRDFNSYMFSGKLFGVRMGGLGRRGRSFGHVSVLSRDYAMP